MQIEVTKKPKSTVLVKGSLSADEFAAHIARVTKYFVDEAELPGFRKGKAPERMVVEKIGEARLLEEAAEEALRAAYPAILKDHTIDAIGQPQVHITKLARGNPLEFEMDIAVLPEIILPDYKQIAAKKNTEPKEEILITDEELNKSLDWLRKSRAQKQNSDASEQDSENTQLPELTDEFAKTVG